MFVLFGTGEQRFSGLGSLTFYSSYFLLSLVLLDGQASQLHCHVHVSEFFFPVEFNRPKKPTLALSSFSFSEINKALDTKEHN